MTHPLDGAWARVQRSQDCFAELRGGIEQYQRDVRYRFEIAEPEAEGYYALRVVASLAIPDKWSVLIGDIAHNLRASLDGVVWQLIIKNGKDPDAFKNPRPEYPIFLTEDDYRKTGARRIHGRVSEIHEGVIERSQPYHWGGELSTLWSLHELNNADKHRAIQLMAARAGDVGRGVTIRGYTFGGRPPAGLTFREVNDLTKFEQGAYLVPGNRVGAVHESIVKQWPDVPYIPVATDLRFRETTGVLKGRAVLQSVDSMGRHATNIVLGRFRDVFHPFPEEWGYGDLPPPDVPLATA